MNNIYISILYIAHYYYYYSNSFFFLTYLLDLYRYYKINNNSDDSSKIVKSNILRLLLYAILSYHIEIKNLCTVCMPVVYTRIQVKVAIIRIIISSIRGSS